MKKQILIRLALSLIVFNTLPVFAQVNIDDMGLAINILKGKSNTKTETWALEVLENSLEFNKNPRVMNTIGIAYLHGIGTEADTAKAVAYMNMAGELGFKLAYHNLGMYYKYASNGKQDFAKAYETFAKGANLDNATCQYNKGFMLYKGLGCEQDYRAAKEEFERASIKEHPSALYMLGLIYRNGYGVEADTARANFYLNRTAKLGLSDAIEELLNSEPENKLSINKRNVDGALEIPDEMPSIDPYVPNNKNGISGKYNGVLVVYDWSGKYVLEERSLSADLSVNNDSVKGLWVLSNDTIGIRARLSNDGELKFENAQITYYDRYSGNYRSDYRFDKADISFINEQLSGELRLYSLTEQEPERPMYVILKKIGVVDENKESEDSSKIYAFPNPFVDSFNLNFELDKDVLSAKICIFTESGLNRLSYGLGALPAGKHSFTISPNIKKGTYIVHVIADEYDYQTIIFKK